MDWLCLAKEVGNAANESCKPIILDKLKECYSYIVNYKENQKLLQEKHKKLEIEKNAIDSKVKREEDDLRVCTEGTKAWLEKVKKLMEEAEELMKKKLKDDEEVVEERKGSRDTMRCIRHSRCNLCRRHDMSKKAKLKADEIDAVIKDTPKDVTEPVSRSDLKAIPNEFLKGLRSRVVLMEEVIKKLQNDKVDAVGIFGMGAIGKTTLVAEISNHKEMKAMFNEIIMVEISEVPNVARIQDQIASKIGLRLDGEQRSTKLYHRLTGVRKLLIILDNVWAKLDLSKVGIPKPNEFRKIMVTSREKNVCEAMEVLKDNIIEVKPLNDRESTQLFRARFGEKANDDAWREQHMDLEKRLLKRCGGLPLSIVATADALKNEESLEAWEHFATELEKPISNSIAKISGVHRQAYSILETSYKLMEDEKKKRFFLLACLFPYGARIPIEDMMRYGIGLDLFENVDNLTEAMEQANRWAKELKSSSLLLQEDNEDYKETHVKIHDVVRASTISLAEQGGEMIMVESFPRWMSLKSCSKYYAISLMSGSNHSRLNKLHSENLRILRLDNSEPRGKFEDNFFEGMKSLMVLVMSGMRRKVMKLPRSIMNLKSSLTTLIMEECELGDISGICELTNLVVLSLSGSSMKEIPKEIGNLYNLRMLDLSYCKIKKGIAANVLSNLSQLEGLYAYIGYDKWHYGNCVDGGYEYEYASIGELNHLRYLKVIELTVRFNEWPIDENQLRFLKKLDHFHISFGAFEKGNYSRSVTLGYNRDLSNTKDISMIRVLLKNTQHLEVSLMKKLQHIFDYYDIHGKQQSYNNNNNLHALPPPAVEFSFLQLLEVQECPEMKSLSSTPFKAPNFTHLIVYNCENMKYIFMEYPFIITTTSTTFPALKTMFLLCVPKLESVTGFIKSSITTTSITTNDGDQQPQRYILFNNHKPTFPKLEELKLYSCKKIGQLWEVNCKEMSYYSSFTNLHSLDICDCTKLEALGSLSIATALVQLKELSILSCPILREVISSSKEEEEEEEETKVPRCGDEIFPSLESVMLEDCPKLKMFIKGGKLIKDQFLKLSSLHHLEIIHCPTMDSFSPLGTSFNTPKLNEILLDNSKYPMDGTKHDINSFLLNHNIPN